MRNIPEYESAWFCSSRTARKRTGLYPDRKRGPWTFLLRYLRLVPSFFFRRIRRMVNSIFFLSPIFSSLVSLASFSLSLFLEHQRSGEVSFLLVRPVNSKREQKEADGRDRWHPVPFFRGKLEEEVAFKIPSYLFYRFFLFLFSRSSITTCSVILVKKNDENLWHKRLKILTLNHLSSGSKRYDILMMYRYVILCFFSFLKLFFYT